MGLAFERGREIIRTEGLKGGIRVLKGIPRKIAKLAYDKNDLDWYIHDISKIEAERDPAYELKEIGKDRISANPTYFDGWLDRERALSYMSEGDVLLGHVDGDRIVFFQWLALKRVKVLRLDLEFEPPKGFCSTACMYTVPEMRGQGLATRAKPHVYHYLKERGFDRSVGLISPKNKTSRGINEMFGAIPYQNVKYKRFLFLKHYRVTSARTNEARSFLKIGRKDDRIWNQFLPEEKRSERTGED